MEAGDFRPDAFAGVAVEAIRHQQHGGALSEHTARPVHIEAVQRLADACAAIPVFHARRDTRQRLVHVAKFQLARDMGEAGSEQENLYAVAVIRKHMKEMEEDAGIDRHRARNIAKDDERRAAAAEIAPLQRDDATGTKCRPERGAHIDHVAARGGLGTAGANVVMGKMQAGNGGFRFREFGAGHLLEILDPQKFLGGEGFAAVDLDVGFIQRFGPAFAKEGFGETAAPLLLARLRRRCHFRQHQRHHLVEKLRVAPEDVESLIEKFVFLVALHERCVERPVEVLACTDAGCFDRLDGIEHLARADAETGAAKHAGKMDDIFG